MRSEKNNSKKRILVLAIVALLVTFSPLVVQSAETIKIEGFVNDYANIISPEYKAKIEEISKNLYDAKTAEFSVVTIESLEGQDIESYAINLAQGKLGDKEKNNGLLLLVAVKDRKYRFEVGRGLEPILNDAKVGRIGRDYLVENFRKEEYGKGIYEATEAVGKILNGEREPNSESDFTSENARALWIIFLFAIFFILVIIIIVIGAVKYYKKQKKHDKAFDAAMMAAILFGGPRGPGGFSGGHSGGFSGGFGGFGGGGFGGGGAGSSW